METRRYDWFVGGIVIACLAVGALLVGLLLRRNARQHVLRLLEWLGTIGVWGPVVFILIEIVVVLFLLPGFLFTMGAGFLFGPVWGTAYVVIGHTLGGTLALLTARTFFGRRLTGFLKNRPRLRDLDRRLVKHGWKTIMLTRLIPFFPFKLSNYAFGVMRFRVRDFIVGTALGTIPISAFNVYAGAMAADLATMDSVAGRGAGGWLARGFGLVVLLGAVLLLGYIGRRRLQPEGEGEQESPISG